VGVPDHFGLFGLPEKFAVDGAALERKYLELSREHHPDRHATKSPAERLAAVQRTTDLNLAYKVLRDDFARAELLLRRRGMDTSEEEAQDHRATVDTGLLMEVLELREALAEARAANDMDKVQALAADVRAHDAAAWERIGQGFAALDEGDASQLATILGALTKIRYYRRFLEEVAAIEDAGDA
jgi:molecular chaperone HscB